MTVFFKKAERKQAKLRLALSGPTGSGKTEGALMLAKGIGGRIAVVDTENSSASLYADRYNFETANLAPPYTPEKFVDAIKAAEQAGFDTLILDSITHEWSGVGGCLEIVDKLASTKFKGNSWGAWSEVTPRHRRFIDAILHSSIHIIVTLRSKMDTVQVDSGNGKKKVEKVGMKSEQRDGIEYEFTTVLDLTCDHIAVATKDRTHIFSEPMLISENTGALLRNWLLSGSADATLDGNQYLEINELMQHAGIPIDTFCAKRGLNSLHDIQQQKFEETRKGLLDIIAKNTLVQQANERHISGDYQKSGNHQYLSDAQRDSLQAFIDERGLDVKTVCEHLGVDALTQIEASKLEAVKQEIDNLAKQGMHA